MENNELWSNVLADLELSVSKTYFDSYIRKLSLTETRKTDGGLEVVIGCPTAFFQQIVQNKFYKQICEAVERVVDKTATVSLVVGEKNTEAEKDRGPLFSYMASSTNSLESVLKRVGLVKELSLETFAVSNSNEMAYAAAKAVSASPGAAYNPLFLYGGVGVGKTHLMQGVGQEILRQKLETKTIYCTGEEFTNGIIDAIRKKSTTNFKKKFRSVNLLLIDDVQFIAGKTTVQEEFFHTFNAILKEGGQVIMTSDKPPKAIGALEERLRSRFEGGLIIDIGEPNFELRTAILMIKAGQMGIKLPLESARVVAEIVEDTRSLIGSLMRLSAEVRAKNAELTPELVERVLAKGKKEEKSEKPTNTKPVDLIRGVASYFGVDEDGVRGGRRVKSLVLPRHVAMFLLVRDLEMSLMEVGSWFGGRDHTTVMHAVEKVELLLKSNQTIENDLDKIRGQLYS